MRKALSKPRATAGRRILSPYDEMLLGAVASSGGFYNAHGHLDRADTLDGVYLLHMGTSPLEAAGLPLSVKQNLTGDLHVGLAYTEADLRARMRRVIERLIAYGTRRLDTCIDVTPDIGEGGMLAFRVASELKAEFAEQITIWLAPNPIFGFKLGSGRWEVFVEAAKRADFLSCLPEKDEYKDPRNSDGKVGFDGHLKMVLALACELKKEVHMHLDQANILGDVGTETLLAALRWIDQPQIPDHDGPVVWVIHMISPSCYPEPRFRALVDSLLKYNVGVIVCSTAALSMRQLRPAQGPTHNSVARVLELCRAGVPVRLGSDNICDVFVPQGDGDMLTEIKVLGHAVRMPLPSIWAKLAAGRVLNRVDQVTLEGWLAEDAKAFRAIDPQWQPAV